MFQTLSYTLKSIFNEIPFNESIASEYKRQELLMAELKDFSTKNSHEDFLVDLAIKAFSETDLNAEHEPLIERMIIKEFQGSCLPENFKKVQELFFRLKDKTTWDRTARELIDNWKIWPFNILQQVFMRVALDEVDGDGILKNQLVLYTHLNKYFNAEQSQLLKRIDAIEEFEIDEEIILLENYFSENATAKMQIKKNKSTLEAIRSGTDTENKLEKIERIQKQTEVRMQFLDDYEKNRQKQGEQLSQKMNNLATLMTCEINRWASLNKTPGRGFQQEVTNRKCVNLRRFTDVEMRAKKLFPLDSI